MKKLKAGEKMVIFPPAFGSSMTRAPPVKGAVDRTFLSLAGDGTKIFRLPAFGALDIRSRAQDKVENRQGGFLGIFVFEFCTGVFRQTKTSPPQAEGMISH